jgi:hypothetical protein
MSKALALLENKLKPFYLLLIYLFILSVIGFGVLIDGGFYYFSLILLYGFSLISFTILINFLIHRKKFDFIKIPFIHIGSEFFKILAIASALFIICHYLALGQIPLLDAFLSNDYDYIVKLRSSIVEKLGTFWNYSSSFLLKAILPFLLIYFLIKGNHKWYYFTFIISVFYALSLIQKSYIITILLPALVYSVFQFKLFNIAKFSATMIIGIFILVFAANPQLRGVNLPVDHQINKLQENGYGVKDASNLLFVRLVKIPGKMVMDWFQAVPNKKPFLKGCGYKFLAPFLGCEFQNYAKELYPIIYEKYSFRGFNGTVNVASFMYDYSNFGIPGLILSAFLLAIIFSTVQVIFRKSWKMQIAINLFYVLMLSSSALTTLLFSGGWGIIVSLFLLVKISDPEFQNAL